MINVVSVVAQYKAGAVPYAVVNGSQLNLFLGDPTNVVVAGGNAYGFLDQSTNQVQVLSQAPVNGVQGNYENQTLMIANNSGAEWASGDGTVIVTVTYTIVPLQ
jgi:hypothetical protein